MTVGDIFTISRKIREQFYCCGTSSMYVWKLTTYIVDDFLIISNIKEKKWHRTFCKLRRERACLASWVVC